MQRCIACAQPLPEGLKEPYYFAQMYFNKEEDAWEEFVEEATYLIEYASALFDALGQAEQVGEECAARLRELGSHTCEEACRRLLLVKEAGRIWEQRALLKKKEA
jgi:hypothetical protein